MYAQCTWDVGRSTLSLALYRTRSLSLTVSLSLSLSFSLCRTHARSSYYYYLRTWCYSNTAITAIATTPPPPPPPFRGTSVFATPRREMSAAAPARATHVSRLQRVVRFPAKTRLVRIIVPNRCHKTVTILCYVMCVYIVYTTNYDDLPTRRKSHTIWRGIRTELRGKKMPSI